MPIWAPNWLRQIFDVDEMLYFVAPDYWRLGNLPLLDENAKGRYPVPKPPTADEIAKDHLAGTTVTSSYAHTSQSGGNSAIGGIPPEQVEHVRCLDDGQHRTSHSRASSCIAEPRKSFGAWRFEMHLLTRSRPYARRITFSHRSGSWRKFQNRHALRHRPCFLCSSRLHDSSAL